MLLVNDAGNAYCETDDIRVIEYKLSLGWTQVEPYRESINIDTMTKAQLLDLCKQRGIDAHRAMPKADLIALLQ